jgi:ADP-ribosylglycohydrolase
MNEPTKISFVDRARAAFLGLALGDAYGRTLEFVGDDSARTLPVRITAGEFRWTDDTHMSIYLAHAVLVLDKGPLVPDRFGRAVGDQFVRWLHDPLMPTTAPGNACLAGARTYERTRQWATSGGADADGCGAVMRIGPLPMAFRGAALSEAARISAVVTHRHPFAIDACVAGSHLLRGVLETGVLDAQTVRSATDQVRQLPNHRESVINALNAAVELAQSTDRWLDEDAIPEHDGGWRNSSALGLAVASALRWEGSFQDVIERAARIRGDSDSVACLAGMFAGAAHGTASLPSDWLEVLPERNMIQALAKELASRPVIEAVAD